MIMALGIIVSVVILAVVGYLTGLVQNRTQADGAARRELTREKILECLPGANCAACGHPDCASLAYAIASGTAPADACLAGGEGTAQAVGVIIGVDPSKSIRMRAQVMCSGHGVTARKKYIYDSGAEDCVAAARLGGGEKSCKFGCVGMGSCAQSCPFHAISVENGVAVVNYQNCTGCGLCIDSCPKHLIRLIPYDCYFWVGCASHERESRARYHCGAGCTGCGECARVCPNGAVKIHGNLASIDYELCRGCGKCSSVCPTGVIWRADTEGVDGLIIRHGVY